MVNEFDPYREALVVEATTVWPDDYDHWDSTARRRVEEQFTWERAGQELLAAYAQMQRGELPATRPVGVSP